MLRDENKFQSASFYFCFRQNRRSRVAGLGFRVRVSTVLPTFELLCDFSWRRLFERKFRLLETKNVAVERLDRLAEFLLDCGVQTGHVPSRDFEHSSRLHFRRCTFDFLLSFFWKERKFLLITFFVLEWLLLKSTLGNLSTKRQADGQVF